MPLAILPAGLHRFLTDRRFAAEALRYIFVRPVRLYFNAEAREQWLRDMLAEGRRNHMLTDEDAAAIEPRIQEPFIQKYLKSLAVHVCTLPVTQIVSVVVASLYVLAHPELTAAERTVRAVGILGFFQVIPISPGSLVRGLYVLYLVIRERNFKDYNIAVLLGFFKYVGYLAFPIQMAYRYPALARFMAGHWATGAVHIIPVFGERGAARAYGRALVARAAVRAGWVGSVGADRRGLLAGGRPSARLDGRVVPCRRTAHARRGGYSRLGRGSPDNSTSQGLGHGRRGRGDALHGPSHGLVLFTLSAAVGGVLAEIVPPVSEQAEPVESR